VKPREGRGSRGIHLQPNDPTSFDDSYLVQELLEGPEITSTFYALENRTVLGCITMVRELESGNTARAEVVTDFDSEIQGLAEEMVRTFPFRGSINIQAKVTPKGIVPFEINCRISGTNSIRSQFGFNDVAYTIQDFLFRERPPQPTVSKGSAMRLMIDVVYPGVRLSEIRNRNDQFYLSL
jgi:carbamoyl-phosphate synthase large subunit